MEVQFQSQQYPEKNMCCALPSSHNFMELGGFFNPLQPIQQSPMPAQQKNQTYVANHQVSTCDPLFSAAVAAQLEKENQDINQLIALQSQRLRVFLQEQTRQQVAFFISRLEAKALCLLRHKEDEIEKEKRKTALLEECVKRMEIERQTWRRIAGENEAMAAALNSTLEQVREKSVFPAEDAESCCDFSGSSTESKGEQEKGGGEKKMACKACKSRESCFLILPCKHLCSCKACEALLDSCPVCKAVKKASIEVYLQ